MTSSIICRDFVVDHERAEAFEFGDGLSGDALKVAVEVRAGRDDGVELGFAFSPKAHCGSALAIEVRLHVGEGFDDRADVPAELSAGEIAVDHFDPAVMAGRCLTAVGERDQRLPQRDCQRDCEARRTDPDVSGDAASLDVLGQGVGHNQSDVGFGGALVIAQFTEPAITPGPGLLALP